MAKKDKAKKANDAVDQNPKKEDKKKTFGRKFMIWVVLPVLSIIFMSTAMVCAAGMIPTGVAYLIDKTKGKYAARTVGYLNIAAAAYVSMEMWMTGDNTLERGVAILGDPINWFIMFGAAAIGWGIYFLLPPVVFKYLQAYSIIRNKRIKEQQKKLVKEWGEVVKQSAPQVSIELMRFDPDRASEDGKPPPMSDEEKRKLGEFKTVDQKTSS